MAHNEQAIACFEGLHHAGAGAGDEVAPMLPALRCEGARAPSLIAIGIFGANIGYRTARPGTDIDFTKCGVGQGTFHAEQLGRFKGPLQIGSDRSVGIERPDGPNRM